MLIPDAAVAEAGGNLDPETLFADLVDVPAICLAVSGGPDSVALLDLGARWKASRRGGPRLHVATVDHGLRPEAAAEAAAVAAMADRLGMPHATLHWHGTKPGTRIQERAREARQTLLGDHCRSLGTPVLLTAHHGDDQAETVLMRLGRGSGIAGLAAMRRSSRLPDGTMLVRPLLDRGKEELIAYCCQRGLLFADDPSNQDDRYARVRLRRQMSTVAALGLTPGVLRRLARRMARADEAVEAEVARLWPALASQPCRDGWEADLRPIRNAPGEIVQRLLARLVRCCVGMRTLSLERLETLGDAIGAALVDRRPYRATLGGTCLALDAAGRLVVVREAPRRRGRPRPD